MVEKRVRFGGWREYDKEPTAAEQMEAVVVLREEANQFIEDNGWKDKQFHFTIIKNKPHSPLNKWTMALRADEVLT
ncbi:hypothetical protein [Gorillibacterium timonense]|uniref:hypothetical protein n=1 Tax=Gorillibacterium timonense TaxID=1689269 RepID=UPI00071CB3B4|nr:hypothetical protein [Gorillibacterium timonense]